MRKIIYLTEEEGESIRTSNKAKVLVFDEIMRDFEQSVSRPGNFS